MMHVLLIAQDILDYSVEYANAVAASAKVTLVAPARRFHAQAAFVDPSIDLQLIEWPRHRSFGNLRFLPRIIRLAERVQPDVIHFLCEGVVWLNLALPFFRRFGIVTTMHDVAYHPGDRSSQRVPRWCVDHLIGRSDKVIVHGDNLLKDAKERYPRLADRLEIIPHVQMDRYAAFARRNGLRRQRDGKINILFFGRIHAYKGLDFLIRSIPDVAARCADIRVIIAGKGDDLESYRKLMRAPQLFDIRDRFISDQETAQLFIDADLVVLPYIEASQSGVLAIANSFAKPVIVTDVGELGRSVEHDRTGLVVPPRDEKALAAAIIRLAVDGPLRERLGHAGRDAANRFASPQVVAERAMQIYQRLAARRMPLTDATVPSPGR
jgi:glycosyltransferase involved in cell wall biosynthesis